MEIPELSNESADFLWETSKGHSVVDIEPIFPPEAKVVTWMSQEVRINGCKWLGSMDYNLLVHEVFWGYERSYEPFTNFLWGIQVASCLLRIKGRKVG